MTFREAVHYFISQTTRYLTPPAVATEWVFVILGVIVIAMAPCRSGGFFLAVRDRFCRLAERRRTAIVLCAVLPIVLRMATLPVDPVPVPSIHDEFSHLLLGDTLAHGRLTNPTHPMWMHFESIHVIQQPTYNSMYPPGQGVVLGFGQAVFGHPWAGVVISVSLMFAAICWMMQGWLPASWALFGTITAILKIGVVGLWINSYLGGAVSATGGALLLGAMPRLTRGEWKSSTSALAGIGMVLLMNTRPFEGAVLSLAVGVYLARHLIRGFKEERPLFLPRVVLPISLLLACGFLFTAYYSWRVTGSPLRMPYQVNRDTYGWPENLAFLPPKIVELRHKVLQDMYTKESHNRDVYSTPLAILNNLNTRLFDNWTFFLGPTLTVPLIFLPFVLRERRIRPLLALLAVIAILNLLQLVLYPYHLGPIVSVIFVTVAECIRHAYVRLEGTTFHRSFHLALILPACLLLAGAMKQQAAELDIRLSYWESAREPHKEARASIDSWLRSRPEKHLVIVRYGRSHHPDHEWVYNGADIDGSKIVWAREMETNDDLLRYFADREAWLLQADIYPHRLVRYGSAAASPGRECSKLALDTGTIDSAAAPHCACKTSCEGVMFR